MAAKPGGTESSVKLNYTTVLVLSVLHLDFGIKHMATFVEFAL